MNLGIYGGSFNPFHYGHLNVARQAIAELKLDKLIVMPANVSPFKVGGTTGTTGTTGTSGTTGTAGTYVSPMPDRLENLRAIFADMPNVIVDDRELKRGGVSYAIDTVREIIAEYSLQSHQSQSSQLSQLSQLSHQSQLSQLSHKSQPSQWSQSSQSSHQSPASTSSLHLYFIIGEDSVAGLPRWREIDELKKLVTFKAYPRTKESSTELRNLFENAGVTVNPDEKLASAVRAGVARKNGFCPCRLPKTPEFFCPCDEFKAQLRDPAYHGLCHCRLYLKP